MVKRLKRTRTVTDKNKKNNTEKKTSGQMYEASIDKPIEEKDEDAFDGFSYKMMSDHDFPPNVKSQDDDRNI